MPKEKHDDRDFASNHQPSNLKSNALATAPKKVLLFSLRLSSKQVWNRYGTYAPRMIRVKTYSSSNVVREENISGARRVILFELNVLQKRNIFFKFVFNLVDSSRRDEMRRQSTVPKKDGDWYVYP